MDEICLKILTYLYDLNKPLEQTEILPFIKSLELSDLATKTKLAYLEKEQYAVFSGANTFPNSSTYNWYWNSLGDTHPKFGLQTLSIMTTLTAKIRTEGTKYIEEKRKHEQSIGSITEINTTILTISDENKQENRKSFIISLSACVFSVISLLVTIWTSSLKDQTKSYLSIGVVLIAAIIIVCQLLKGKSKRK